MAEESAAPRPRLLLIMFGLVLGMFVASLDQTIVSTALPTVVRELGGLTHLSWVVTGYILAATASTPLWGKLGDLYGRKRIYQIVLLVFLVGSALCGLAQNMTQLIGFRALQGLGGGGLFVTAQAAIADVVGPRERGRFMGFFGAIFGVSSVGGPLAGGWIVDHWSWRWVFYINLPIGAVAISLIALFLTLNPGRGKVAIDYLGTALIAAAATCLVLMTTLGGNTYPWTSWPIVAFGLAGVALLVAWVLSERRAVDPVLPLGLFKNRVFSLTAAVGFIVGLAMFGCITFLPLFMQVVHGVSPTASGLQLTPIMLGLLTMSIVSGQLISRTGRYKVFPIAGTLITTLGLFLLSRMDENTPRWETVVYMAVIGVGLGLVMQVLVIIVQNAVEPRDLGVATSSAQFFRSMGASLGVALFGAIFTNQLAVNVAGLTGGGSGANSAFSNTAALRQLPAALQTQLLHAFASALDTVFLAAMPVALLGFALAWFVPEIPLRRRQPAQVQEVAAA